MPFDRVDASPETIHWGFFSGSLPPVLTVDAGDTIVVSTLSGGPEHMPAQGFEVPAALSAIHAAHRPKLPGHICTGPIGIRGARPGQVLEVRIKAIELLHNWGWMFSAPQMGALPNDFEDFHLMHMELDPARMTGRMPWGLELKLKPFFGVMGVAPPRSWGELSTVPPRRNGGNIDNKELVAGTTLYLPVHTDDALFSVGDGHALQGDGEVCTTAIETGLVGTFELHLRDDFALVWPMAETPTHLMTMAFDPSLELCVEIALRSMLDLIVARTRLSRQQAYALCSLVADVRVTQVVNGNKGIHVVLEKAHLQ